MEEFFYHESNAGKNCEGETIHSVCEKIEKIYFSLTGKPCLVTVKLIRPKDEKGDTYCEIYARSETNCRRDDLGKKLFEVSEENTVFHKALQRRGMNEDCSHFHSEDLTKEDNYRNERQNWKNFYKSTIVVPIRYHPKQELRKKVIPDDLGFLCVDTRSTNRLKKGAHVQILAALADQMYNFLSLMKGRYITINPKQGEDNV
ncbi:MAG: hypothetical protein HQK96_13275 [Nitrospirae bacterium]|nr:hypothetical protein [Nitrospirota bacterium]